jgi:hypothetical protein
MKQRLQGMVAGILIAILFMGTVTAVAASTRTIQATYGVNVVVDGAWQQFAPDMQPFISGGRTFLPVRGIADAFGVDVEWISATQTVYLNTPTHPAVISAPTPTPAPQIQRRPLLEAVPSFESGRGSNVGGTITTGTVNILGQPFSNAIFSSGNDTAWSHHNLNNQFSQVTGRLARVDGSSVNPSTIVFIGDGIQLAAFTVDGDFMPTDISIDVSGVRILRIEITRSAGLLLGSVNSANIAIVNAMIE